MSVWDPVHTQPDLGYRRQGAALLAFGDSLFLLGGTKFYPGDLQIHFTTNDVFQTNDGINWNTLPVPSWSPRTEFVAAVLSGGNMYVMGGWTGDPNSYDVRGAVALCLWIGER